MRKAHSSLFCLPYFSQSLVTLEDLQFDYDNLSLFLLLCLLCFFLTSRLISFCPLWQREENIATVLSNKMLKLKLINWSPSLKIGRMDF